MATQAQLDALDAAIASGVTEVRIGEKIIKYNTASELITARATLASLLRNSGSARYKLADFSD